VALATKVVKNPHIRPISGARAVTLETGLNLSFAQRELTFTAGEAVLFTLKNVDSVPHNFVLVKPGELGENMTTTGIDLLSLPRGTILQLGATATVEVTGLRNPCKQIDGLQEGLMEAVLERSPERGLIRKAGIMGIVISGGEVRAGDTITITLPPQPHEPLKPV
jgi:MOSC domain-containing protein YiiM